MLVAYFKVPMKLILLVPFGLLGAIVTSIVLKCVKLMAPNNLKTIISDRSVP